LNLKKHCKCDKSPEEGSSEVSPIFKNSLKTNLKRKVQVRNLKSKVQSVNQSTDKEKRRETSSCNYNSTPNY
jgi:hypothetical protein